MSAPLTRAERDELLARAAALERELYPPEGGPPEPTGPARVKILDAYYKVLHEYGDRLPRVPFSRCPHTQLVLKRSLDPYGLDGPWWHKSRIVNVEEPAAAPTFKVLLGALNLNGREPAEAVAEVIPGPEAPFVVPRLLELPGMQAVVSRLALETGDTAHVIAYFSGDDIPTHKLHQHWLRQDLWFPNASGGTSWLTMNDPYDFDLQKWIAAGKLWWIAPADPEMRLVGGAGGAACPYAGLAGDPHPQILTGGKRGLLEIPNGTKVNPFAEW